MGWVLQGLGISDMKKSKRVVDFGTAERQDHGTIVPALYRDGSSYDYHAKVMDATQIDRLLMDGKITPNQHNTLERFSEELRKAGFMSIRTIDLSDPIQSSDPAHIADRKAAKLVKIVLIFKELEKVLTHKERDLLVDMCLTDRSPEGFLPLIGKAVKVIDDFFVAEKLSGSGDFREGSQ